MHLLKIKIREDCPNREFVIDFYKKKVSTIGYKGDCGVDLIFPDDIVFQTNQVLKCNLGISCEFFLNENDSESAPFRLVPRSSISNTPLMLANSEGIFDAGYRGPVIAALRCYVDRDHPSTLDYFKYVAKKGDRVVQIVAADMMPIKVVIVDELTQTERGDKGFGSTNAEQK